MGAFGHINGGQNDLVQLRSESNSLNNTTLRDRRAIDIAVCALWPHFAAAAVAIRGVETGQFRKCVDRQ